MNIEERKEYNDYLHGMCKLKLIAECFKLRKRLDRLSAICDIEDVNKIMQENFELNRKTIRMNRAKSIILSELDKLAVQYDKRNRIDVYVQQLIEVFKERGMMNEELPYEQQMKPILEKYDKLVEENESLKEKAKELERYKSYARTPGEVKSLVHRIEKQKEAIDWSIDQINEYLRSLGIDAKYHSLKSAVNAITKI